MFFSCSIENAVAHISPPTLVVQGSRALTCGIDVSRDFLQTSILVAIREAMPHC